MLLLLQRSNLPLLSLFIIILTSIFSVGFLHPDEHYQILELLHIKLQGKVIDPTIFNWDYHLKIRSWLQPFIYYIFTYPLQFLDGFTMATLIRLFNGLFGLLAIQKFLSIQLVSKERESLNILKLILLTWFVPLLLVRTNSESLSTSLFLLGYFYYEQKRKPFSMIFLSLSFLVRYQMALVICPLIFIDLLKKKICPFTLAKMTLCFLAMIALGSLIDYWGYESWSLTPYNYFFENLIEGKASHFGVSPFYYYFSKPFLKGIPPISFIVFFLSVKHLWKKKSDSLTLAIICFIFVHSLIPHKEVRFLNFIYILLAIFSAIELYKYQAKSKKIVYCFVFINILVMLKTSLLPAHSRINLYKEVYDKDYKTLYTPKGAPLFKFSMPFYMDRVIATELVREDDTLKRYKVLTSTFSQYKNYRLRKECKNEYSQYPMWIERMNVFNWLKRSTFHAIWNCQS